MKVSCTTKVAAILLLVLVTGVVSRHHKPTLNKRQTSKHGADLSIEAHAANAKVDGAGSADHVIKRRSTRTEIVKEYNPAIEYPAPDVPKKPQHKAKVAKNTAVKAEQPENVDSNLLAAGQQGSGADSAEPGITQQNPEAGLDAGAANNNLVQTADASDQPGAEKDQLPGSEGPVIFTIANSNTGRSWKQLPYREKFQWSIPRAPCYQFDLVVPDERTGHNLITLCIYRRRLDSASSSGIISYEDDKHVDLFEQRENQVHGQVVDFPGSEVFGRIVQKYFYGEISLVDRATGESRVVYVVEEVKLLYKLFHRSRKLFHNIVEVVSGGTTSSAKRDQKYNAVITRRGSLLSFLIMDDVNRDNLSPMPVLVLTTRHASYIVPGATRVTTDDIGQMTFESPDKTTVKLDKDGSIVLQTYNKDQVYTFRPNGTSMLKKGVVVTSLQKREGSLAISAVSNTLTYGCVLPSHSFSSSRKGGYLCKICLAADRLFQQKYLDLVGLNNTTPVNFLGDVIDRVSWIYRGVDWNGDGKPDNIGLDFDMQFMEWQYEDDGNLVISKETLDVLFESVTALDFSDCCLGIAYTLKKFPPDIYAKSATSTLSEPGGVCTLRKDGRSKNVILISAQSKSEKALIPATPSQLIYLTAHEIGKAFGSGIDTSGQPDCDSFQDEKSKIRRHYLLWPDVFRPSISQKEKSFSSCSKRAIVAALDGCRSSCFEVDLHPFCGNGVKEEGEECDCGSEYQCFKQNCCYGRTGTYPCRKTGFACGKRKSGARLTKGDHSLITILLMCAAALYYFK